MREVYITDAKALNYIKQMFLVFTIANLKIEVTNKIVELSNALSDEMQDAELLDSIVFYKRVLSVLDKNTALPDIYSEIRRKVKEEVKHYNNLKDVLHNNSTKYKKDYTILLDR